MRLRSRTVTKIISEVGKPPVFLPAPLIKEDPDFGHLVMLCSTADLLPIDWHRRSFDGERQDAGKLRGHVKTKAGTLMIRVFIGYDPREAAAYSVLAHSIQIQASTPVSIAPLMLAQLGGVFGRARDPLQSTDFAFSRFLVPYLCDYQGWAIFMDCDMLMRDDIAKLWACRDERYAVQVVQHDHVPRETTKFLGQPQVAYPKKNWSSVMLMNNAKCEALTPTLVSCAPGLHLHRFEWLSAANAIGALPKRWNHLVGYDAPDPAVGLAHFTLGGPYFSQYANCEFANEWHQMREGMLSVRQTK